MKLELDETALLQVSGVAALAYGLSSASAPKQFHDAYHPSTAVFSETSTRYAGVVGSWLGSQQLVLSARDNSREGKRDMLKVAGFGWLACAATHAYNANKNAQLRDISTATALGQAVLGGLCLWKGYEE